MNIKNIIRLAEIMEEHGLSELEVHDKEESIRLCSTGRPGAAPASPVHAATGDAAAADAQDAEGDDAPSENTQYIVAPMPGTFFTASSPQAAAYVHEGSDITENSVVCIIEAMKVMNEVKAECSGTIVKCLVENGAAVEYGQKLFEVR